MRRSSTTTCLIEEVFISIEEFAPWTADVVHAELDYIRNMYVEVYDKTIHVTKGLLSGWRMTTFIGSLVSELVAMRIKEKLGRGDLFHVVQGDDILLFGTHPCRDEDVLSVCGEIGVNVNTGKCMFGVAGEFLKKIYSPDSVTSYPGRTLRSIFFANPWLEARQWDDARQISNVWHSLYSRLLPYRPNWSAGVVRFCAAFLARWSSTSATKWAEYLRTPASVGGGGFIETTVACGIPRRLCIREPERTLAHTPKHGDAPLFSVLGLWPAKMVNKDVTWYDGQLIGNVTRLTCGGVTPYPWGNCNKYKTIHRTGLNRTGIGSGRKGQKDRKGNNEERRPPSGKDFKTRSVKRFHAGS
uniref:Uncharacterized protein n=1 Tax=Trichuris muris TaxID=70415 RepID=A0A5S6QSJ6_TRIMR